MLEPGYIPPPKEDIENSLNVEEDQLLNVSILQTTIDESSIVKTNDLGGEDTMPKDLEKIFKNLNKDSIKLKFEDSMFIPVKENLKYCRKYYNNERYSVRTAVLRKVLVFLNELITERDSSNSFETKNTSVLNNHYFHSSFRAELDRHEYLRKLIRYFIQQGDEVHIKEIYVQSNAIYPISMIFDIHGFSKAYSILRKQILDDLENRKFEYGMPFKHMLLTKAKDARNEELFDACIESMSIVDFDDYSLNSVIYDIHEMYTDCRVLHQNMFKVMHKTSSIFSSVVEKCPHNKINREYVTIGVNNYLGSIGLMIENITNNPEEKIFDLIDILKYDENTIQHLILKIPELYTCISKANRSQIDLFIAFLFNDNYYAKQPELIDSVIDVLEECGKKFYINLTLTSKHIYNFKHVVECNKNDIKLLKMMIHPERFMGDNVNDSVASDVKTLAQKYLDMLSTPISQQVSNMSTSIPISQQSIDPQIFNQNNRRPINLVKQEVYSEGNI